MTKRVLVVEDNPANLELMMYLLRALGYAVECENNGKDGLANALSGTYDLVLTDILMPGMDGFEFARRFKADPRVRRTPLVALTALAMMGDKEKIMTSGFDGYISKPIDPKSFGAQISPFVNIDRGDVLIVDDDENNRLLLVTLLRHQGHTAVEAASGVSALELTRERPFQLIIVDLSLPDMAGIDLIRKLRTGKRTANAKIALYTATTSTAALEEVSQTYGICAVIPKPGDPRETLALLTGLLAQ